MCIIKSGSFWTSCVLICVLERQQSLFFEFVFIIIIITVTINVLQLFDLHRNRVISHLGYFVFFKDRSSRSCVRSSGKAQSRNRVRWTYCVWGCCSSISLAHYKHGVMGWLNWKSVGLQSIHTSCITRVGVPQENPFPSKKKCCADSLPVCPTRDVYTQRNKKITYAL